MTGVPGVKERMSNARGEQFDAPDLLPLRLPLACSTPRPSPREQRLDQ